uniref:hypothetical protein n=1 Tax=Parerythrobacter lutipelagi TaxID=1964208 RepID=UPI0010F9B489|nr:hypothetical protein [Parerythrobacter lutipelagi]
MRRAYVNLVAFAALAAIALPASAVAEENSRPCPGKADSPLCVMQDVAGDDGAIRGAEEATRLVDRYTSDAVLSDGEKAMLQMLLKAGDDQAAMLVPLGDLPPMEFGIPDKEAIDTVRYFFAPPEVEKALFDNDDEALVKLIEFYGKDVTGLNGELKRRCAAKLDETFKQSTIMNGYQPYKDVISGWYQRIKLLEPAQFTTGRELAFRCAERHANALRGAVPPHLYAWLEP